MQYIFTKFVYVIFFLVTLSVYSVPLYSMFKDIKTLPSKKKSYIYLYAVIFLLVVSLAVRSLMYAFDLLITK
jgi:hypothetical protein